MPPRSSSATAAFGNAREPLGPGVQGQGRATTRDAFGVIVNHFKSKGSGADDGTGQGNANPDRVAQADASWPTSPTSSRPTRGITKMFLTGDFNAYSEEDPIQVLEGAGYTNLESDTAGEESYSFSGQSGSLDHVFANDGGPGRRQRRRHLGHQRQRVDRLPVRPLQLQRHRLLRRHGCRSAPRTTTRRSSGIEGPTSIDPNAPVDVQILGTNDFHGRILNNTNNEAGAAVLSGAVKQFRAENPNTVFAAAGDLIGASTFESFIQKDKPTIDALNEAGLEVSAAGNHEFDQGYDDLVNRVMKPYDATTNEFGGAKWQYIAANIRNKAVR